MILFLSCTPSDMRQEVKTYHDNNNLSTHYYLLDDKKHGIYKEYYPSGKLQIERNYDMDSLTAEKVIDINDKVLVNYVIKDGHYYGLLGSSQCISVYRGDTITSH